ncbi:hypothetical protein Psi02_79190 [Planotetraspora silvatica]|uniref:Uncharacterized protein n=1 Tax=Planotetraspora silvatica TaxID=234614 RepID=A0A8J3V7L3_9ACTN|nr:hypothetical protein Psi02_79190 [Planotetraspora silvatica]
MGGWGGGMGGGFGSGFTGGWWSGVVEIERETTVTATVVMQSIRRSAGRVSHREVSAKSYASA